MHSQNRIHLIVICVEFTFINCNKKDESDGRNMYGLFDTRDDSKKN